jgi:hypothetical protein
MLAGAATELRDGGVTFRVAVAEKPSSVAVRITCEVVPTGREVITKVPLKLPAATATEVGTIATAAFELPRSTVRPTAGAGAVRTIVP